MRDNKIRYSLINRIFERVYRLKCQKRFGFTFLSNIMLKISDPIIKTIVNGQECYINFSHQGVYFMYVFPNYDKNLGKICQYLKNKYKRNLFVVDVGANVGDTILCIGDKENYYYAVEGEQRYYSLLRKNLSEYNYELIEGYCGDKDDNNSFRVNYVDGTGSLVPEENGKSVGIRTMDSILSGVAMTTDFIKIDTDGFDFAIIRGMEKTLIKDRPVLYFEWTAPELMHNNEDLLSAFVQLNGIGYNRGLIFDNFGNFLCTIETQNLVLLRQLIEYSLDSGIYYDVCLFHESNDIDLFDMVKIWRHSVAHE